mgnify:CR=1 FL=1
MFHKNLKNIRLKNGLSQKQVADYLSISPQSISKWEKGDATPSIEFLPKLAECLSCEINDFFVKEKVELINYSLLYEFFELEKGNIYSETETTEDIGKFFSVYPDLYEIVVGFCNEIKKYKTIKRKNIKSILSCSDEEAEAFVKLFERMELIEKLDTDDLYYVIGHAVDGLITLMKIQLKLYNTNVSDDTN